METALEVEKLRIVREKVLDDLKKRLMSENNGSEKAAATYSFKQTTIYRIIKNMTEGPDPEISAIINKAITGLAQLTYMKKQLPDIFDLELLWFSMNISSFLSYLFLKSFSLFAGSYYFQYAQIIC
eukprot:TRINITY_DN83286_c0_g1_i1.p1 TRINITY_DN83286_c0_g1~~TRINITY_DN83286_c0_g1_i1.p1  ORF type:complete len:126 (-),score=5.91 TRINITY_DN83286_c0_g1_i1:120-497(-)